MALPSTFYKLSLCLLLAATLAQASAANKITDPNPLHFKKAQIKVGGKNVQVELAETDAEREHGLMFRDHLGDNEGMLFIFQTEDPLNFWMKNTFIDLAIGYYDKSQTLKDIQEMAKVASVMEQNPPPYPSRTPAQYALEMNKGWFSKNKIKVGSKFEFIPGSKSKSGTSQITK